MARNPFIPWKRKIMKIDQMALIDCQPEAIAMVAGVGVAAFHVIWSVIAPDCVDAAWDRVKGGAKHRGFKMQGFTFGPTITPGPGTAGLTMIAMGNIAQKIGFAFALGDGVINGVLYGSSLARRYSGCFNNTEPGASLSITNQVPSLLPAAEFILNIWQVDHVKDCGAGPTGVALTVGKDGFYSVFLSIEQEKNHFPGLPDCEYTTKLDDELNGTITQRWSKYRAALGPNQIHYAQDVNMHPGFHNLRVIINKTEGVLFFKKARFLVQGGAYNAPFQLYKCGTKLETP